jgi:hypothetical protein
MDGTLTAVPTATRSVLPRTWAAGVTAGRQLALDMK